MTLQEGGKKKTYKPVSFMNTNAKNLNKILSNPTIYKKYNISWLSWINSRNARFNIRKINEIHHNNRLKKNHISPQ